MKTISLTLPEDTAELVLKVLQTERSVVAKRLVSMDEQIEHIKKTLKAQSDNANGNQQRSLPMPGKRAPKGEAERLILGFLKLSTSPGESAGDIAAKTGTNYYTAHRVLTRLKADGKVNKKDDLWFIA